MKRIISCLLMMIFLCVSVGGVVSAEVCPPGTHDVEWLYTDYEYQDQGDYHKVYTMDVWVCSLCGMKQLIQQPIIGIEGHNLTMTHFDRTHDSATDTHKYTYQCIDCSHEIEFNGECDGPPCKIIFLPASFVLAHMK